MAKFRILSLDGGGFMGVIAARALQKLNLTGSDFDLIAGTSTGAILAAGLRIGLNPSDILELYRTEGEKIFPAYWRRLFNLRAFGGLFRSRYSSEPLKEILKKYFGKRKFTEVQNKLIVNSYNIRTKEFLCFRSWCDTYRERDLHDVILSSCSAPVYFESNGDEVDGGVVVNNPSMVAIAAALKEGIRLEDIELVSIGTGKTKVGGGQPGGKLGAVSWGLKFAPLTLEGTSKVVHYQCKEILEDRYFRFDPEYRFSSDSMDDASKVQFENLLKDADYEIERIRTDRSKPYLVPFQDRI